MKKKDLVWRELIDSALTRHVRRWDNVEDLAFRAGVPASTAVYALRRLIEIGAVQQHHAGFTVVNPDKVLTCLCASRSVVADVVAISTLTRAQFAALMDSPAGPRLVLGGADAAVELLGGVNTVADYQERVVYLRDEDVVGQLDDVLGPGWTTRPTVAGREGASTRVLLADSRAARVWGAHTSFAQTYVDLFATPGWQASEFRLALHRNFLGTRDWDQDRSQWN